MNNKKPEDTNNNSEKDFLVRYWSKLKPEEVLSQAFHELRDPIYLMVGFINVLKNTNQSPDEITHIVNSLLFNAVRSKNIVDSVYAYINTRQE